MDNLHNNVAHEAELETIWPAGILFVTAILNVVLPSYSEYIELKQFFILFKAIDSLCLHS